MYELGLPASGPGRQRCLEGAQEDSYGQAVPYGRSVERCGLFVG